MRRLVGRLQTKLILTYLFIIGVILGVVGLFVARPLEDLAREQIVRGLEAQARLMALEATPVLDAPERLQRVARKFRRQIEARVTVIDRMGRVLAESDREPGSMENHADRPEVQRALAGQTGVSLRHSASVGRDLLYVAIPLEGPTGITSVLRVALPLAEVERTMASIQRTVAYAAVLAFGIAIVLSLWMARRVSRPVTTMVEAAHQMAEGDLSRRVAVPEEQELAMLARALNTLGQKLQEKLRNLGEEQARTAGILESMVEGLVAIDQQGRIVLMNAAARRMLRLGQDVEGTRHLLEIIRHPELRTLLQECDTCAAGTVCRRELTLHSPPMTLMVHAVPLRRGADRGGTLLVFHDVTELRHLERVRQEFVANASHELRTPLTAIRGYVETLVEGAVDEPGRARPFLDVVGRHAERMSRLVDDLLDLSNIESGRLQLERHAVPLGEVARPVFALQQEAASKKEIALRLEIPPDLPAALADRDRLQQILINLVDNAIKFTPAGQVTVAARRVHGSQATASSAESFRLHGQTGGHPEPSTLNHERCGDFLEIAVSDTGTGISSTDLPRVTERFYRVDRARSRELGGTGLGLSIVKHLVHAHGGELYIESELGQGTTVRFTLPVA
ncbi:MAG: ATP-binding protein [Candidatus Methylomirabilales bacterium]